MTYDSEATYDIRNARVTEYAAIKDIEMNAAKRFTGLGLIADCDLDNHMLESRLAELVQLKQVWVACLNDQPVGFVVASTIDCGCLLEELDVLAEHGRKGLGRRLVKEVLIWAKEKNHSTVILSTFKEIPWNEPFYQSLGFAVIAESEYSSDLHRLRANEVAAHLPIEKRVFMRIAV